MLDNIIEELTPVLESRLEAQIEARVEAQVEARVDAEVEAKMEARDLQVEAYLEARDARMETSFRLQLEEKEANMVSKKNILKIDNLDFDITSDDSNEANDSRNTFIDHNKHSNP